MANSPEFDLSIRVLRMRRLMDAESFLIGAYPAGYWLEFGDPDSDRFEHDDAYQARAAIKRALAGTELDIAARTGKPAALVLTERTSQARTPKPRNPDRPVVDHDPCWDCGTHHPPGACPATARLDE